MFCRQTTRVTISILQITMLISLMSSSHKLCALAFRVTLPSNTISHCHRTIRASTLRCTQLISSNNNNYNRIVPIQQQTHQLYMSTNPSLNQDNNEYNTMTVSELRDVLKSRGLKVSGIKAELVERLESGAINVGNRPNVSEKKKKNEHKGTSSPDSLVFAKEGEDDSDSDEEWDSDDDEIDPNSTAGIPEYEIEGEGPQKRKKKRNSNKQAENANFRDDFLGTRVFVQNLPEDADWKELKDHFQDNIDGEVVYASVSMDREGRSKRCGIVQFETSQSARAAIKNMRNHPLNGSQLYVREDYQETRGGGGGRVANNDKFGSDDRSERMSSRRRNDDVPDVWKRANDEAVDGGGKDWYDLTDEELKEIEDLIQKRDKQRKQRNYKMSDRLREMLKEEFGVHLDDRLKMWWTDTQHGGVPGVISEIKGEGRWGSQKPWRQIPTTPDNDAMVDTDHVMALLNKRDKARRRKDFNTADDLLQRAHDAPQGGLGLRIHDESRTWRIWTENPPPRKRGSTSTPAGFENLTPAEMCLQLVRENEPDKVEEMESMLNKFVGREWAIFKRLKGRYNVKD